jgi:valyl-tRNA synthetase
VVEPRLSDQWFVRMAPLARPALEKYRDGTLRFIPERRGDDSTQWLVGIRDWCISRQLWWGHRIPVWYCESAGCGRTTVSRTDLDACPACGGPVRQDEDVLDTWFSSWLVPFSSLGWPDRTPDLAAFYPGHTLASAADILFFWVARMIMSGLYFMGEVPYTDIYLHGTVRDTQHRKMSKSLGNGIDPLEVVERYGADALRYSLVSGMSVGTDVILDPGDLEGSFAAGRNFANKLWNAGRFVLSALSRSFQPLHSVVHSPELDRSDRWLIARCDQTVIEATDAYERYRLNDAAGAVYRFIWHDIADWYIETNKKRISTPDSSGNVARSVIAHVFDVALRLLHPIMPFVTEELWRRFPGRPEDASISVAPWPRSDSRAQGPEFLQALYEYQRFQEQAAQWRVLRATQKVPPGRVVRGVITARKPQHEDIYESELNTVRLLVKVDAILVKTDGTVIGADEAPPPSSAQAVEVLPDGTEIRLIDEAVDKLEECARLGAEIERLTNLLASQEKKLSNQQFVTRAPIDVVEKERTKLGTWTEQRQTLVRNRELLGCG